MEFFRWVEVKTDENSIQEKLTISNIGLVTDDLFVIGKETKVEAEIGGLWGEFTLRRTEIKGGVRFALLECPNALVWTITAGLKPNPNVIVVHLTINRETQTEDFISEINEFLNGQTELLLAFNSWEF